jgi:hypothetical protein
MNYVAQNKPEVAVKAVWWYADRNRLLWKYLDDQLVMSKRSGLITTWHRQGIQPGKSEPEEIQEHWQKAELILPLVSSDLLLLYHSPDDHCVRAMEQVWERYKQGAAVHILPILVDTCDYGGSPFGSLLPLPGRDRPIVPCRSQKDACAEVAKGIRQVVEMLLSKKWQVLGDEYDQQGFYDRALHAYDMALNFNYPDFNQEKDILRKTRESIHQRLIGALARYEQDIVKIEQAVFLDPHILALHKTKGDLYKDKSEALAALKRFDEAIIVSQKAIEAYDQVILLQPDSIDGRIGKGQALEALGRQYSGRAQQEYQQAEEIEHSRRKHRER